MNGTGPGNILKVLVEEYRNLSTRYRQDDMPFEADLLGEAADRFAELDRRLDAAHKVAKHNE